MKTVARLLLTSAILATHASAQELPPAESILDRFVEVTGGKAAYDAQKTRVVTSTFSVPQQQVSGPMMRYYARPNREYDVLDLAGIGKAENGFNNDVAWMRNVISGPHVKNGLEKEQARRDAQFDAAVGWRQIYQSAVTDGTETIKGEPCFRVVLKPSQGPTEIHYFSIGTGLRLKIAIPNYESLAGTFSAEQLFSNYKSFGGVLFPTRELGTVGGMAVEVTTSDIAINAPIPPAYFDIPSDVKALTTSAAKRGK